jgi:alcohol dehydrogenase (cytochrome c)
MYAGSPLAPQATLDRVEMDQRIMSRFGIRPRSLLIILALCSLPLGAAYQNPEIRWRLGVIALKASGRLPDLRWGELVPMLKPSSGFWLAPLLDTSNPYAVVRSPYGSDRAIRTGRVLFHWQCEQCHGRAGTGGSAPALVGRELTHGLSDLALFQTIRYGVRSTAMAPHDFPQQDLWKLVSYIQSLETEQDEGAGAFLAHAKPLAVKFTALQVADRAATDWPTYYGSYNGQRFSDLSDINQHNVSQLQVRWIYQLRTGNDDRIQTTPIVADGRLILTTPSGGVIALDAVTGQQLWRFSRALDGAVSVCCATANRGVAVLDGSVFVATLDAHLIALDGGNGKVLWDRVIADYRRGYSSTGAPLAVKSMIITGIAGSEYGSPGFITAYDAHDGHVIWRFLTIPGPGEPGHQSWAGDSWRRGGVSSWMTGTYDPDLDLLYWGTGNAAPDYDATVRAGDNLYSDSVVALHVDTGKLAWYFQFTPNDDHDWDSVQDPVLADVVQGGRKLKLLLQANRNGFMYALDRTNGQFLWAKAFVKQNWAERIDEHGRPVRRPEAASSPHGSLVYPGTTGGTNWWPPTYSPLAQLLIVPALERAGIFFRSSAGETSVGQKMLGGQSAGTNGTHYTTVRALDPLTGDLRWEYRSGSRRSLAQLSGLLSTAGGLVLTSDQTQLIALDITNGHKLWSFEGGGSIYAPPISYRADGQQFIAFVAGDDIIGAALPPSLPPLSLPVQRRTASR